MVNASSAFSRASSGSMTDNSASAFNSFMGNFLSKYSNLTGWLGGAVESVKEAHNTFMTSRMWEFSNRFNGKDGVYVGRFEIGYLSEAKYQAGATGFMRDYIMANPNIMQLYLDERVSGYEGDFSSNCIGIGRGNYFYDKSMDGLLFFDEEEETLNRTTFLSSRDNLGHLTFKERVDIHRTWNASNAHIAKNLFDPTSIFGGNILSVEEVEEIRRKREEEQNQE